MIETKAAANFAAAFGVWELCSSWVGGESDRCLVAILADSDVPFAVRMACVVFASDALSENSETPRSAAAAVLVIDPASAMWTALASLWRRGFCMLRHWIISPFGLNAKSPARKPGFFAGEIFFSSIRQTARFDGPLDTSLRNVIVAFYEREAHKFGGVVCSPYCTAIASASNMLIK